MHQSGNEEKAALLLASADDDDASELRQSLARPNQDDNPVITRRPKPNHHSRNTNNHSVLFFILILCAFIFGCLTGVLILLYRLSQETDSSTATFYNSPNLINIDLTIQTKVLQSITKKNFLNHNRSIESENDAATRVELEWQSLTNIFTHVNKISYDLTLSKYALSSQLNGLQLFTKKDEQLGKFNAIIDNNYLSFSSLIKSGRTVANYMYYVNYGRQEDFAHLIKRNLIDFKYNNNAIVFMRRKSTIISQTEQIRQAMRYGFAGVILFDYDEPNQQITTTDERQTFSEQWASLSTEKERQKFLDGISKEEDHQIFVLILSNSDVEQIFSTISFETNQWLTCPSQWHNKTTALRLGGSLRQTHIQLTAFIEEVPVHLPVVLGYIQGRIDTDHFIMVGYQLGRKQQEDVINEIIQAFGTQITNGWRPRRSIIFCAWSGLIYDHYTIRRWVSDNYQFITRNLVAYIDLGYGIIGNSTLNLHGSPLLQQVAQRAADVVVSPLIHNHTCHHRRKQPVESDSHSHSHVHRRKRHEEQENHMDTNEHEEQVECEPHKLLDEWIRASNNRIGVNKSLSIVQMIDVDSSAAFFQLQYGIPSIVIEMTEENALLNDTFYLRKSPLVSNDEITPEVAVAYAQFISEVIRQLIDEPLIPFNLTDYADLIHKQAVDHLSHYEREYQSLSSYLGASNEMIKLINELIKSIRQIQSNIDQTPKNNYINIQKFNEKLIDFERLFIRDDQPHRLNTLYDRYKHVLFGPAFGLTNSIVPFPSLSNVLYGIGQDSKIQLSDTIKLHSLNLKQHFKLITKTLNAFDGLLLNS